MNNNEQKIRNLLQHAFPPPQSVLRQDLWPQMLHRLEDRVANVPWFDWALIALLITAIAVSPRSIPLLLYHL